MFGARLQRLVFLALAAALCAGIAPEAGASGSPSSFQVFWQDREKFVALKSLAATYEAELSGPVANRLILRNPWHELVFRVDSREAQVNGAVVWLHAPVQLVRGRWAIAEVDASRVIDPILRPGRYLGAVGHRVVVIDPGHGGQDTGAAGARGLEEKRAVLDIARRVRAHLTRAGVRVYMTREKDRFVELDARTRIAARWGADAFISIHLNSAGNVTAQGVESFVLASAGYASTAGGLSNLAEPGNQFEQANGILGYQVHRSVLAASGSADRGVKRSRFLVLKNAPCPAVLVECGFVSNRREEERLLTEGYRERIAQGLARGTLNYLNLVKRVKAAAE